MSSPSHDYYNGWSDALAELEHQTRTDDDGCLGCLLVRVRFAGIARSIEETSKPGVDGTPAQHVHATNNDNVTAVVNRLLDLSLDPDPMKAAEVIPVSQQLVLTEDVKTVSGVVVQMTLLAARRYMVKSSTEGDGG